MMSLEAPLLAPSAPPMTVGSDSDDCFLDDAIDEVRYIFVFFEDGCDEQLRCPGLWPRTCVSYIVLAV